MIDAIVVHTAAAPGNADSSAAALKRYHVEVKGWRDIGYQRVVTQTGNREQGRPFNDDASWDPWEYGAAVSGANDRTFNICCTGHGDLADFTHAQKNALIEECADACIQFGKTAEDVIGHREVHLKIGAPNPHKTCPGKKISMEEIRDLVRAELLRRKHDTEPSPALERDSIATELEALAGRVRKMGAGV
jgi:N-acetyl-anhydromuramyl-L-alanine amidase AmpD